MKEASESSYKLKSRLVITWSNDARPDPDVEQGKTMGEQRIVLYGTMEGPET
jgi:hypothetical protein